MARGRLSPATTPIEAGTMNGTNHRTTAAVAGVVCWILLVASTPFPALYVDKSSYHGWSLLFLGWSGIVWMVGGASLGWGVIGWLANLFFVLATLALMVRHYRIAIAAGAATI